MDLMADNVIHIGPHLARKRGVDRALPPWRKPFRAQVGPKRYRRFYGEELRWMQILQQLTEVAEQRPEWAWHMVIRLGLVKRRPATVHGLYDAVRIYCHHALEIKREFDREGDI